ncbi:MAG: arsenite efflux ATP-binding protein ArsA [Candidatus Taylorbacteria bacterium]|nr:arsenite efflux ATP-binding protein ArsA [Candidatus Taylorbacteria bacterium]
MITIMKCGKGGVGKTTVAVSTALYYAGQGYRTAVIDYDGGHSVTKTLGLTGGVRPNHICHAYPKLDVIVVESLSFTSIVQAKEKRLELKEYLAQFPEDFGLVPLVDMVNGFFGIPTDIPALQKFLTLVSMLCKLEDEGYEYVIIDVEPTAGLERLLSNADTTVRSLRNLSNQGMVSLMTIGAKWPDIGAYLKGDYMKKADHYCARITQAVESIVRAKFVLVCIPEYSPVTQTFEVRDIIHRFNGKVSACVVNNIRGEPYEASNIKLLEPHDLPIVQIERRNSLHGGKLTNSKGILLQIGRKVVESIK